MTFRTGVFPKVNPRVAKLAKEMLAEFRHDHTANPGCHIHPWTLVTGDIAIRSERADNLEQKIAEAIWKYHDEECVNGQGTCFGGSDNSGVSAKTPANDN